MLVRFLLIAIAAFGVELVLTGSAAADPPASSWARLRACEAGGRYDVAASHGHYGAYQFDLATWRSVGGRGYPHRASPREQDYRALYLYRMRGWQPWTCARRLGLREDGDGTQQAGADPRRGGLHRRRPATLAAGCRRGRARSTPTATATPSCVPGSCA